MTKNHVQRNRRKSVTVRITHRHAVLPTRLQDMDWSSWVHGDIMRWLTGGDGAGSFRVTLRRDPRGEYTIKQHEDRFMRPYYFRVVREGSPARAILCKHLFRALTGFRIGKSARFSATVRMEKA